MTESRTNPLGYEAIPRLLSKFAIPSIIAMLVSSLYNIVDQIFIGMGVGYLGNAATTAAYPMVTICLAAALLIGVGGAAKFSLELGAKNIKYAKQSVGNMFWMAVAIGVILCIICLLFYRPLLQAFGCTDNAMSYGVVYLKTTAWGIPFLIVGNVLCNIIRADGSPVYSMICMLSGALINIILDPIFIFKLDMGTAGAAYATVISQVISCVIAMCYLFRFKTVKLDRDFFRPNPVICAGICALGLSNSMNQVAITLLQIVLNNSLKYYGTQTIYGSDIVCSGAGIVMKVNTIVVSVFIGLSQGSQPILGYNYGAKQYERVKAVYKLAIKCSFVVSILAFLVFQFLPQYIIMWFDNSQNELFMEFTTMFMRTFLFMMIINNVQMISSNFFSAIGKPIKGLLLSLSRQILLLIPLILILPLFFGLKGILYAGPTADAIAFIICIIFIRLEFRKMDKSTV